MHRFSVRPSLTRLKVRVRNLAVLLTLLLVSPVVARAQGFTSATVHYIYDSFGTAHNSLFVRNVSTPLYFLTYGTSGAFWRYATRTGTGAWAIDSTVTGSPDEVALVIPSASPFNPHVVLLDHEAGTPWVQYATKTGSTWSYESIVPRPAFGDTILTVYSVAIAISGITPSVLYSYRHTNGSYRLAMATRGGDGVWTYERVRSSDPVQGEQAMSQVNLRVTSAPAYHASFVLANANPEAGCVAYSTRSGGSGWTTEPVISGSALFLDALALAPSGIPMIAYSKASTLYWASRQGPANWPQTNLGPMWDDVSPRGLSMVSDGGGFPLIAYVNSDGDSIRFASKSTFGWNFQRVAPRLPFGVFSPPVSIGLYSSGGVGRPQIVYEKGTSGPDFIMLASGQQLQTNSSSARPADGEVPWVQDGEIRAVRFTRTMSQTADKNLLRGALAVLDASEVTLEVLDLQGRRVAAHALGALTPGEHEVDMNVADLPTGVYFVTARLAGGAKATTKLAIVR